MPADGHATQVAVREVSLERRAVQTRMPFRFGALTVTETELLTRDLIVE